MKKEMKTGVEIIAEERKKQIEQDGWTAEHDAQHVEGELANAAATYAMPQATREALSAVIPECKMANIPPTWPWDDEWYKPTPNDRIRELAKAGALIAAEIDRLNAINQEQ